MGLRERVLGFISYKDLTNRGFERACGLSNGAVSNMGDDTRRATIDKISMAFPELNPSWLLTGEGEMLLTSEGMDGSQRLKQAIAEVKYREGITQKAISEAMGFKNQSYLSDVANGRFPLSTDMAERFSELYPYVSARWLVTGEGSMIVGEDDPADVPTPAPDPAKAIRYYPNIPATASHVENMPEPSWDDLRYEPMWITGWEGCSALNATGDSMYPRISNGDVVIFRRWTESYVSNGEIYLVITRDGDRMIKYVTEIEPDEEGGRRFRCASANPDQERFAPFVVAGEDIVSLYVVCGCIKRFRS